jgi:hypothetical protein
MRDVETSERAVATDGPACPLYLPGQLGVSGLLKTGCDLLGERACSKARRGLPAAVLTSCCCGDGGVRPKAIADIARSQFRAARSSFRCCLRCFFCSYLSPRLGKALDAARWSTASPDSAHHAIEPARPRSIDANAFGQPGYQFRNYQRYIPNHLPIRIYLISGKYDNYFHFRNAYWGASVRIVLVLAERGTKACVTWIIHPALES